MTTEYFTNDEGELAYMNETTNGHGQPQLLVHVPGALAGYRPTRAMREYCRARLIEGGWTPIEPTQVRSIREKENA